MTQEANTGVVLYLDSGEYCCYDSRDKYWCGCCNNLVTVITWEAFGPGEENLDTGGIQNKKIVII